MTEHEEQKALIEWSAWMSNARPELSLMFAVPNGGDRHPAVAAKLKAEGVKAGVPDIFLPVPRNGYHGLFIELKRAKGGRPTIAQKQWIEDLTTQGYRAEICHGAEQAISTILDYLNPVGTIQ